MVMARLPPQAPPSCPAGSRARHSPTAVLRRIVPGAKRWLRSAVARFPRVARVLFGLAAALFPRNSRVCGVQARLCLRGGDVTGAIRRLERFVSRVPRDAPAHVLLAVAYDRAGRAEDATAMLSSALARTPYDLALLQTLARLASRCGDTASAQLACSRILERYPDNPQALLTLANQHYRSGAYEAAAGIFDRVLATTPANAPAILGMARVLFQQRRWDEALTWFERLRDVAPETVEAHLQIIRIHMRMDREPEAAASYATACQRFGGKPGGHLALATALERIGLLSEAAAHVLAAMGDDPGGAEAPLRLGRLYARAGQPEDASAYFSQYLIQHPGDRRVRRELDAAREAIGLCRAAPEADGEAQNSKDRILCPESIIEAIVVKAWRDGAQTSTSDSGNVVLVTASLGPGGAERQLVNTLRGLSQRAACAGRLHLLCGTLSVDARDCFFHPVVEQLRVPCREFLGNSRHTVSLAGSAYASYEPCLEQLPFNMRRAIAALVLQFHELQPLVVHAWQDSTNLHAAVAAAIVGVPHIVLSTRSIRPDEKKRRRRRYFREVYQILLHHPSVSVLNNSQYGAHDYTAWLGAVPGSIRVIHNGFDFRQIAASAGDDEIANRRVAADLAQGVPVIGTAFRMTEEKRPRLWIDVASCVAQQDARVHFLILGDGPMRPQMEGWARDAGIANRCRFVGHRRAVAPWLSLMDMFLLTSRIEGLPNVLIEAQALGVPVVSTDAGGAAETFEDGQSGWLLRTSDAAAIAERLLWSLAHPDWLATAAAQARKYVQNAFGLDHMVDETLQVYACSADKGKRAPLGTVEPRRGA